VESIRLVDPSTQRSVGDATGVTAVARTEVPPTSDIRTRAEREAEHARDLPYLSDVADKLERLATGLIPDGVESLLPRLWDPETDALRASVPDDAVVIVFDPHRAADEAERAVEQEEELASLWADPAHMPGEIHADRAGRVRDEQGVLFLPLDRVTSELRAVWRVPGFVAGPETPAIEARPWETSSPRALLERSRELKASGYDVIFCATEREVGAVGTRLTEEHLADSPVVASQLHGGVVVPPLQLAIVTHTEWHA